MAKYLPVAGLLLGLAACKPIEPVDPPTSTALQPAVTAQAFPGDTTISRITVEDLGCFGPCPRYVITVLPTGELSWTNLRPPSSTPDGRGSLTPAQMALLVRWFRTALPRLARTSANVGLCDGGCSKITLERTDTATMVWVFDSAPQFQQLSDAAKLVRGMAARTALSPCP